MRRCEHHRDMPELCTCTADEVADVTPQCVAAMKNAACAPRCLFCGYVPHDLLFDAHTRHKTLLHHVAGLRAANKTTSRQLICCLAAGPLPAHHRRTRCKYVPVSSYAASMPRKVPRRWAGKDQARWSVMHGFKQSNRSILWCGVLAACGTVWRHGCRHRAPMDGFTACPASGEGTAPSTLRVGCRALARPPSQDTPHVRPCRLLRGIHAA